MLTSSDFSKKARCYSLGHCPASFAIDIMSCFHESKVKFPSFIALGLLRLLLNLDCQKQKFESVPIALKYF